MKDRAGFFAGCADILTDMCVYYAVAAMLVISNRSWGVHLFWLLLCPIACAFLYAALLKKPRSVPFLTVVTGILFAAQLAVFLLASSTPAKFGYVFVLAVGAGMGVGLPLYYGLNRPLVHKHLTGLDVLILVLFGVLLCREALGIDAATVALMVIVLLMDAAAAVGLRMTDGGSGDGGAFKASMVALGSAVVVFLVIGLLIALFSRSGGVTGGILQGIGALLAAIGGGFERFFRWLSGLVTVTDRFDAVVLENEMPSLSESEQIGQTGISMNTTAVGIALCVLVVAAAVIVALTMRKKTLAAGTKASVITSESVKRSGGGIGGILWRKLRDALRFRWTAFRLRSTPAGLLVVLERLGAHRRRPRREGESMRQFIERMDTSGGLKNLADALDEEYYGGGGCALSPRQCRELRRYIRKAVQHG